MLHGRLRDAATYFAAGSPPGRPPARRARARLIVAPQFLTRTDRDAYDLPPDVLHWTREGWEGGDDALGPRPLSSFEALDAILARLGDRARFPNLSRIVVAGHSGGGQVAQRYAVLSRAGDALARRGVR